MRQNLPTLFMRLHSDPMKTSYETVISVLFKHRRFSIIVSELGYLEIFRNFASSLQVHVWIVPQRKSQLLPSTCLAMDHS